MSFLNLHLAETQINKIQRLMLKIRIFLHQRMKTFSVAYGLKIRKALLTSILKMQTNLNFVFLFQEDISDISNILITMIYDLTIKSQKFYL